MAKMSKFFEYEEKVKGYEKAEKEFEMEGF